MLKSQHDVLSLDIHTHTYIQVLKVLNTNFTVVLEWITTHVFNDLTCRFPPSNRRQFCKGPFLLAVHEKFFWKMSPFLGYSIFNLIFKFILITIK